MMSDVLFLAMVTLTVFGVSFGFVGATQVYNLRNEKSEWAARADAIYSRLEAIETALELIQESIDDFYDDMIDEDDNDDEPVIEF